MKPELKPCPFCGSTNIELDHTDISVVCGDCAAEGPFGDADMEFAIEAWNNRAECNHELACSAKPVSVPSSTEILTIWAQTNEDCPLTHCEATRITRFVDALLAKYGQNTPCCRNPSQCWEPCGDLGNSMEHARAAETAKDHQKSDALNTQPSATDRKEIMKPALDRADLAFIYDELRQAGKDRAAELVRAALLAKCGQQGYTAADMASAAADGFRKGEMSAGEDAARYRTLRAMPPGMKILVQVAFGEWEEILSGDELDGTVDSVRAYVL